MRKYFEVNISRYISGDDRKVYRAASLNNPKDESVMFVRKDFLKNAEALLKCENCLVIWPEDVEVPEEIAKRHAIIKAADPHNRFAKFFTENAITYLPKLEEYEIVNGAYIAKGAVIGEGCKIFPGAYIGGEVTLGDNVYVGSGTRLVGEIHIGNNVVIRENSVVGADGLSTMRDVDGTAFTIPQFGGVIIEDNVQIGACTVIARGAIDNTVISKGCKIDNACFVSHNNFLEENVFMVGESTTFGSVHIGKNTQISGNATIRNGLSVGANCLVGAGAMVMRSVKDDKVVMGNPAKEIYFPGMR